MTGQLLADRAKKARAESCCCLCGRQVQIGQRIGHLTDGTGWAHIHCIVTRNRDACPEQPSGTKEGTP